jgi:hypothetical protein
VKAGLEITSQNCEDTADIARIHDALAALLVGFYRRNRGE